ncbi:nicotinate-nucleotide adenylyltransferase [candidate division NPL-UPA2 bacterium]|nr:nicotinate-nucleotide adenylyltransferase [candidate division NPL-UPA2 bacterium]
MRIGILGGTFNPIHYGHLLVAAQVREKFDLEKVIFVPSASPPHKNHPDIAPPRDRYQMTVLATQSNTFFSVSDLELQRPGKSYSVETVKELLNIYGKDTRLYFITGTDAILEIFTWKAKEELLKLCQFVVATRPGFHTAKIDKAIARQIYLLKIPNLDISSTDIRSRIKEGRTIKYLLPEKVEEYIYKHGLYKL